MDFFEHQERARKSSGRLVLLFALAVAGIVASVYLAAMVLVIGRLEGAGGPYLWDPRAFVIIAVSVLGVVAAGSLWKSAQLKGGGGVVARRLGGRRLDLDTDDLLERRLLNVVQEMAIASGTPVPEVWVLDHEPGINAFAAGHGEGDAVIGVTRGAMEKLTRAELQGVTGHEFSHLLNGDMRLNLRLMGILHGILLIGIVGRVLMRTGGGRRRSRRGKDGGGQIALFGLALFAIGYIGTFFGNLIKAAVSRQREFLADASAVQFTRDPGGISHALAKIGGLAQGSRMTTALADEASHMFFGDGMVHRISSAMATHPPLPERIRRIDPSFDGRFAPVPEGFVAVPAADEVGAGALSGAASGFVGATGAGGAGVRGGDSAPSAPTPTGGFGPGGPGVGRPGAGGPAGAAAPSGGPEPSRAAAAAPAPSVLDRIGRPGPEHLERARSLWGAVPEPLREAARRPDGAIALAFTVLLAPPGPERKRQLALLEERDPEAASAVAGLLPATAGLDPEARLPLLEVAAGALGTLPPDRFEGFARTVRDLVEGDNNLDLSEWVLSRLLLRHLRERLEPGKPPKPRYRSMAAFSEETSVLLSALAHAGDEDEEGAARALAAATGEAGLVGIRLRAPDRCPPRALEAALETFRILYPEEKRRLVSACAASIAADARVTPREAELFRVVADWIGAPVPPLLPGQELTGGR